MTNEPQPAEHFGNAAREAKDGTVDAGRYVADRFTAPASGDRGTDQELKDNAKDTATEAKEQGKGLVQNVIDGAKFTASPTGESGETAGDKAQQAKEGAQGWFSSAGDKAGEAKEQGKGFFSATGDKAQEQSDRAKGALQEAGETAGNKLKGAKDSAVETYEDAQQTVADKLATDPVEEARAQGRIPADTQTALAAQKP